MPTQTKSNAHDTNINDNNDDRQAPGPHQHPSPAAPMASPSRAQLVALVFELLGDSVVDEAKTWTWPDPRRQGRGERRGSGALGGGGPMYESHWLDLVRQWRENPAQWRRKVLDEVLNGKGVPPTVRARLWLEASGAAARKERFGDVYAGYVEQAAGLVARGEQAFAQVELQIRKDVRRTYPLFIKQRASASASDAATQLQHELVRQASEASIDSVASAATIGSEAYSSATDEPGPSAAWKPHERSLYNVLCATALCGEQASYHQGINYVAALLLISLHDSQQGGAAGAASCGWAQAEEDAFWVLFAVLQDYHLGGIYEFKSSFLQQFLDQFDLLVRRFHPRLHQHLELGLEPGFPVVLFAMEWFTTVFSYSLRLDAVFLVWDLFLVARLDEALYVAGLAILERLKPKLLAVRSFEEMVGCFKALVAGIRAKELRDAIRQVVQRIVPSALIPPGRSTLAVINREMHDETNVFNTHDYDATQFVDAVQVGDARTTLVELKKYRLPVALVEQALLRASFLGFARVVQVLLTACDASCRHSLSQVEGLTPLHVAALMGHPTVARVLLHARVDPSLRCYSEILRPLVRAARIDQREDGYTALDIARAVAAARGVETSALLKVLQGDVCLSCGRLLEERRGSTASSPLHALWDAVRPDWDQAVKRGIPKAQHWDGDYCAECDAARRATSAPLRALLDLPLGPASWHCRHCRGLLLGERAVKCMRCMACFCASCAFTKRKLLPRFKSPVQVCQNCHHFLRSCPCHAAGERAKRFDVVCEHVAVDYGAPGTVDPGGGAANGSPTLGPGLHFCHCEQCRKRRYTLKAPLQESKPPRYDPTLPLYSCPEALSRGYWGYGDRSILSVGDAVSSDRVLRAIQQIEDFAMSRIKYAASLGHEPALLRRKSFHQPRDPASSPPDPVTDGNQPEAAASNGAASNGGEAEPASAVGTKPASIPTAPNFRDYRAELVEFYTIWNPSQLGKVDKLLSKYAGKEDQLLNDLHRMYSTS